MHPPVASFIAGTKGTCACLSGFSGRGGRDGGVRWGWGEGRPPCETLSAEIDVSNRACDLEEPEEASILRGLSHPKWGHVRLSADGEAPVKSRRCGCRVSLFCTRDNRLGERQGPQSVGDLQPACRLSFVSASHKVSLQCKVALFFCVAPV